MKITNLLEMTTPSSDPSNMGGSQAPKFGRDPHVLEDDKIEETTAGSISTGEPTNMGMQTRGKGSMFQGIKTSKKFVNSPVTEAEKDPEQEKIDTLRRSRQEKERGSERELGRDPKPTGQYYIMINGTTYKKDGEAVMFNSSMEAHRATERISAFRKSKGWGTARYEVIQQKGMEEALDPKAMSALKQAKQSIAKNREADVASWEQDFRKNFAAKYGMPPVLAHRPLNIPAAKSATKPLEKHSVLKNRMAKLNRVIDNQKYLDYLTFKAEQKGLLNPRLAADIDTSLYVKGAEKDDYEALSQKIDKSIDLLKNRLGINKLAYKKPKTMREEGNDPYKPEPYDEFASDTYGDDNPEDEQGVAESADVMEADLSEEHIMAKDLFKRFDLFKQGKDRALGNKPADKEIMAKEGQLTAERLPKEYIEKAIYRVLMKAYPEVINQYGAPIVSDAISSVADMHKDIENIEAEEASIMLHQVISQLKRHLQMREEKQRLDPSCWKGYKKQGTKMKGGVRVNNCVPK
jgi:hypothetical protein